MVSNIDNGQACRHVQNTLDNLRSQLIKFTDQWKIAKQEGNSWN